MSRLCPLLLLACLASAHADPAYREMTKDFSSRISDWLQNTGGMQIPLKRNVYPKIDHKFKDQY